MVEKPIAGLYELPIFLTLRCMLSEIITITGYVFFFVFSKKNSSKPFPKYHNDNIDKT